MNDTTRHKARRSAGPWDGERADADSLFAPPKKAKQKHAMESAAARLGTAAVLLAICTVAAVGVFMPTEDKRPAVNGAPKTAAQQANGLAYDLAMQRVQSVAGLSRPQRLAAGREALARVQGADVAALGTDEITSIARRAPENVRKSAFRGVNQGEAAGVALRSQELVERLMKSDGTGQTGG